MTIEVSGIDCRSLVLEDRVKPEEMTYFGFVYVGETRVGFDEVDGLWCVIHWPEASLAEAQAAYDAIQYEPWGHRIPPRFYQWPLKKMEEHGSGSIRD